MRKFMNALSQTKIKKTQNMVPVTKNIQKVVVADKI